jgi:hypothetical protein
LELDRRKVASAEAIASNFGMYTLAQAETTRENTARGKREEKQQHIDQRMKVAQSLLESSDPAKQSHGLELMEYLDHLQQSIEKELFGDS